MRNRQVTAIGMTIVIGSDHVGFELKEIIKGYLREIGIEYEDIGVDSTKPVDYPDVAFKATSRIRKGEFAKGILICGTGIGMAISANKIPGIYAAVCHDVYSTERSRKSNNANVMTMGSRVIGSELAKMLVKTWLTSEFEGEERHPGAKKVTIIENKTLH